MKSWHAWPNLGPHLAQTGTIEVTYRNFDIKYLYDIQKAPSGVNFVKIARKVGFGPILGQIRSNMGQKSTLKVKSH